MSEYRKAWVAGAFMAVIAGLEAAQKLIPMDEPTKNWVSVALAVLGVAAVWAVPNATKSQGHPVYGRDSQR